MPAENLGRKVAVMQPYLFPYLGTYQLAHAADCFVFFDDVAFIKKGYIHRNQLLLDGQAHAFSVPVRQMSQNRTILQHDYTGDWEHLRGLLHAAYRKAPNHAAVMPLVEAVIGEANENVAHKNARSLRLVFEYLGLAREWRFASDLPSAGPLRGAERIQDLCRQLGAQTYVNASGGRALYDAAAFSAQGLALRFLQSQGTPYAQQGGGAFVPNLSMLDLLMHLPPEAVREQLTRYTLAA